MSVVPLQLLLQTGCSSTPFEPLLRRGHVAAPTTELRWLNDAAG